MNGGPVRTWRTYADDEWARIDLTWSEDGSTVSVPDPEVYRDPVGNPARGILLGLLLSVPIWLGILLAVRWAVSRG